MGLSVSNDKTQRLRDEGRIFKEHRIIQFRLAKDFADYIGYTPFIVSKWENGKAEIPRIAWAVLESLAGKTIQPPMVQ